MRGLTLHPTSPSCHRSNHALPSSPKPPIVRTACPGSTPGRSSCFGWCLAGERVFSESIQIIQAATALNAEHFTGEISGNRSRHQTSKVIAIGWIQAPRAWLNSRNCEIKDFSLVSHMAIFESIQVLRDRSEMVSEVTSRHDLCRSVLQNLHEQELTTHSLRGGGPSGHCRDCSRHQRASLRLSKRLAIG